jgi:hypothetical protein
MTILRTLQFAGLTSVLFVASIAGAQPSPDDRAAAESLFRDGRRLMDEGQTAQGCRKLEESQRLDAAPGTLLNLAVCHEKEGKIASAWADFNQALAQARKENRPDRESLAREHIAAIEPRLPRLVLEVPAASRVPGLKVSRNGSPLHEGAWGTAIPVDPGDVIVEAEAPGHKKWSTTVRLDIKGQQSVSVPLLETAPVEATPAPASSNAAPPPPAWTGRKTAGVALGAAGVVALGVGGIFGLKALSKRSDSDAQCPTGPDGKIHCTQVGVTANDDARSAARISDLGLGLGVVLAAAGGYLFFAGGESSGEAGVARRLPVDVSVDPRGGARATIGGVW